VQVRENELLGKQIQELTVVNQRDTVVDCSLPVEGTPTALFSFDHDSAQKHCLLTLKGSLDYEKQTSYILLATVKASSNSRQKRQVSDSGMF